jgi:4-hydroxythreonine-4-phosphate dehydrogenase
MKRIGITLGDVNGIGPEVAIKAIANPAWRGHALFTLIGPRAATEQQAQAMALPFPDMLEWIDTGYGIAWNPGTLQTDASTAAASAIQLAVEQCLSGRLDAMVTAPISKEGFHRAGIKVPGHTELLAELTNTNSFGMMLIGGGLRVMLVTRHLPIRAVADALTIDNIRAAIELTGESLHLFGIEPGRIGVCGLNPHAGDGGILGTEEKELIEPAIRLARERGFIVSEPVPADTIFYEAVNGKYDAVVAMYHDQGLGPLKMAGFDEGVNVTLGLPIIRTSPDHGTAFAIAGKNRASATSMQHAIQLAIDMAGKANPWK